jgi:hypothetical protein
MIQSVEAATCSESHLIATGSSNNSNSDICIWAKPVSHLLLMRNTYPRQCGPRLSAHLITKQGKMHRQFVNLFSNCS